MSQSISPKRPLLFTALRPVNISCEHLRRVLDLLSAENANFAVVDEDAGGQIIIKALTESDFEVICESLARYNIYVECGRPEVIYLETIREPLSAEERFVNQSGGRGQYAHLAIRVEPNPGDGYELLNELPKSAIPDKYIGAIDKGIRYALGFGVAGHEVSDVKVTLCNGSYHEQDSDEASFETAGFIAMKEALRQATPILLEPVVSLQLVVPKDLTGSVIAQLKVRGADIIGIEGETENRVIRAIARLSKILDYAGELNSVTQESGSYSAALLRYQPVEDLPPAGDDRIGVTANKPWKPKPRRGAVAVEPPWWESSSA